MDWAQSVDDKTVFVFVGDANTHHFQWLESDLLLIFMGMMLLIFTIRLVVSSWCAPTHIAGNRLDLLMTDVPDIVDVFIGTPLK